MVKPAPPPPLPPPEVTGRIADAKKVFVSNVGEDGVAAANLPGGADACYNTFYASLKQWGHYQLVSSPKDADLVFEISATEKHWDHDPSIVGIASPPTNRGVRIYPAIITLKVDDNLTRSTLWETHAIAVTTANRQKTKLKQFDEAIEVLTERLKEMAAAPDPMKSPSR
jgi:hypothetical protein